jgi:signal transduction histidine kinase/CheY-like chemotaxis protein
MKENPHKRKVTSSIVVIVVNLLFVAGVVTSLIFYAQNNRNIIKGQNVDDIGNITESSAKVAQDFFTSQKTRIDDEVLYIKNKALSRDEALDYIIHSNSDDLTTYELISTTPIAVSKSVNSYDGWATVGTSATATAISYHSDSYGALLSIFTPSAEEKTSSALRCSIEFTDLATGHQSFALYSYLDLSDGTKSSTYVVLSVHRSSVFAEILNTNTSYQPMALALINQEGDYLLSSAEFKNDNLFRYFRSFNGLSLDQMNADMSDFSSGKKSEFYYRDAGGADCVFVSRNIGLSDVAWSVVSVVPLASFKNVSSNAWVIPVVILLLCGMFAFDLVYLQRINRRLKEAVEKEKAAALKAEEAAGAKSDFFSRMSHDIRTPLNVIIGSSTLALKEGNNPATARYLADIDQSGKFLLSLVNDLLDLNKVQSGKMVLHLVPFSLKEFGAAMSSIIGPLCQDKNLSFTLEGFDDPTPYMMDAIRFKQIFYNLLSNSVKFTPAGGKISLRSSLGEFKDGEQKLTIVESDTGIGMSEEFQKEMFDPFSQEERMASPANGTGLGLAIVKSLTALMGGDINVRSALGVGSTFALSFRFKKSSAPLTAMDTTPEELSFLKGKRILLCEDNPLNAKIAKTLLESKGMIVDVAVNGKAGLDKFATSQPHIYDLILMDMRMPVMDGVSAAKAIRALSRDDGKDIPIVAMTANAYEEDIKACLDAGMTSHLAKPVDPAVMYNEIAKQIAKRSTR